MTTLEEINVFVTTEEAEEAVKETDVDDENTIIRVIDLTAVETEIWLSLLLYPT